MSEESLDWTLQQALIASGTPISDWRPIETAPHDKNILVFGKPTDIEGLCFNEPGIFTAYWDDIDRSFCLSGATWLGPFISPSHWMPLPTAPSP